MCPSAHGNQERALDPPETKAIDGCESLCWYYELNPGPQEEHQCF